MTDIDQNNVVKEPQADTRPARRLRWYAGYFLLALANIVTISTGTLLNYVLVSQYEHANEMNQYWSVRLGDYAELETLFSLANAPGNDVFSSLDPDREAERLESALVSLERKFAEMRSRHEQQTAPTDNGNWNSSVDDAEKLAREMSDETQTLLANFKAGNLAEAGRGMATQDRLFGKIMLIAHRLEEEAQKQQRVFLGEQVQLAEYMRDVQYVIGGLIAFLVIAIAAYGYRLARQMQRDDKVRAAQLAAIEASEQRFRELAEGSIQGIVVHRDGVPLFVNDAWANIHGFEDAAAAIGLDNLANLVLPEDRASVRDFQNTLQEGIGNSRQYEYRARRRDGKTVWLECLERTVVWKGEPALQSTVIDATERKLAEEGLRAAILKAEQATNARTRFFAAASHDLRQPLHAISLYLPLLQKRMEKNENRELLGAIQNSCNAMRSLLDSLLDISRLDAGVVKPETGPVSLLDIFDQLGMEFTPQAAAKGLELRVVPVDYWVRSDSALLERILRNMLTNAIRYTDQGKILLGARRKDRAIRVEVWDTGIGIAPETLKHIFEEFYQADNPERDRSRGLGLGLAIIERLATLLDHKLEVRSQLGRGSMFSVTLARTEGALASGIWERGLVGPTSAMQGRLVVLIDDDPIVIEGTQAMLEDWGCRVVTATSAAEAIESIGKVSETPDVIIADLRLRGGETGLEAIEILREKLGHAVPAIIVTGDTDPGRIRQVAASGNPILHKPVEPEQLQSVLLGAVKPANAGVEREKSSREVAG